MKQVPADHRVEAGTDRRTPAARIRGRRPRRPPVALGPAVREPLEGVVHLKVIGIVGSPREKGNTEFFVRRALDRLAQESFEVELVTLRGKTILSCQACLGCRDTGRCVQEDDFGPIFEKMVEADGIIVGSPVYFGSAAPPLMALLDRAGYAARASGRSYFSGKVGAPIAVARRAGHNFTFAQLLLWYFINGMVIPGSSYWTVATAGAGGERDAEKDEEGIRTIEKFAANMAEVLRKVRGRGGSG